MYSINVLIYIYKYICFYKNVFLKNIVLLQCITMYIVCSTINAFAVGEKESLQKNIQQPLESTSTKQPAVPISQPSTSQCVVVSPATKKRIIQWQRDINTYPHIMHIQSVSSEIRRQQQEKRSRAFESQLDRWQEKQKDQQQKRIRKLEAREANRITRDRKRTLADITLDEEHKAAVDEWILDQKTKKQETLQQQRRQLIEEESQQTSKASKTLATLQEVSFDVEQQAMDTVQPRNMVFAQSFLSEVSSYDDERSDHSSHFLWESSEEENVSSLYMLDDSFVSSESKDGEPVSSVTQSEQIGSAHKKHSVQGTYELLTEHTYSLPVVHDGQHAAILQKQQSATVSMGQESTLVRIPVINIQTIQKELSHAMHYSFYEGEQRSLVSLQRTISYTTEQTLTTIKNLCLKMKTVLCTHPKMHKHTTVSSGSVSHSIRNYSCLLPPSNKIYVLKQSTGMPIQFFTFSHEKMSSLEQHVSSGPSSHLAVLVKPKHTLTMGISYEHNTPCTSTYKAHNLRAKSTAVSKTSTKSLSTFCVWNAFEKGCTGHVSTYTGWGRVTHIRRVMYAEKMFNAKGDTRLAASGGLVSLGYTLPIFREIDITPYIEGIYVATYCRPYKETGKHLASYLQIDKEYVWEKVFGIRGRYMDTDSSQIQTWVAVTSGKKNTAQLRARPISSSYQPMKRVIPTSKNVYTKCDLGFVYDRAVTADLTMHIRSTMEIHNTSKVIHNHTYLLFQFAY